MSFEKRGKLKKFEMEGILLVELGADGAILQINFHKKLLLS